MSTPLQWAEVDTLRDGGDPESVRFRTDDVLARVAEFGDLFDVAGRHRTDLPAA